MFLTCLALAGILATATPSSNALLEIRIFEVAPPPAAAREEISRGCGVVDTFRLDLDLMSLGAGEPLADLLGLGPAARGRLLSSPKIVVARNQEGTITTGEAGARPDIEATVLWGDATEEGDAVRLAVRVKETSLGGTVRLRNGETWLFARAAGDRLLAMTVTLRILE